MQVALKCVQAMSVAMIMHVFVNTRLQSVCESRNSWATVINPFPSGVKSFAKSEVTAQDVRQGEDKSFFAFMGSLK